MALLRYHEAWVELPTEYLGADETYFYYQAISPGLSLFTAVGERRVTPPGVPIPLPAVPQVPLAPSVIPSELLTMLAVAGAIAGFSIIYGLTRPSRYYLMLKRLERAAIGKRLRRVREPLAEKLPKPRRRAITMELSAMRQLRRALRGRRRKTTRKRLEKTTEKQVKEPAGGKRKKPASKRRRVANLSSFV